MIQDTNNYWEQLERLEKLFRGTEFKAGIIFSFHGVVLGLFVDRMDEFNNIIQEESVFIILAIFWLISIIISVFYCFKCFKPRIESKYDKNVFFFQDAVYSFGNIKDYVKRLTEVCTNEEEICTQLAEQIHVESKIIDQKIKSVQNALKFFGISVIFVIIAIIIGVIKLLTSL